MQFDYLRCPYGILNVPVWAFKDRNRFTNYPFAIMYKPHAVRVLVFNVNVNPFVNIFRKVSGNKAAYPC